MLCMSLCLFTSAGYLGFGKHSLFFPLSFNLLFSSKEDFMNQIHFKGKSSSFFFFFLSLNLKLVWIKMQNPFSFLFLPFLDDWPRKSPNQNFKRTKTQETAFCFSSTETKRRKKSHLYYKREKNKKEKWGKKNNDWSLKRVTISRRQ